MRKDCEDVNVFQQTNISPQRSAGIQRAVLAGAREAESGRGLLWDFL